MHNIDQVLYNLATNTRRKAIDTAREFEPLLQEKYGQNGNIATSTVLKNEGVIYGIFRWDSAKWDRNGVWQLKTINFKIHNGIITEYKL